MERIDRAVEYSGTDVDGIAPRMLVSAAGAAAETSDENSAELVAAFATELAVPGAAVGPAELSGAAPGASVLPVLVVAAQDAESAVVGCCRFFWL